MNYSKTLLLLVFILCFHLAEGHVDKYGTHRHDNLQVSIGTGFHTNEFRQIGSLISEQCNDFLSENYDKEELPNIFIKLFENYHYDTEEEREDFFLGYDFIKVSQDSFYYLSHEYSGDASKKEALIISINTRVVKGSDVLKLLAYGLEKEGEIRKNQKEKETSIRAAFINSLESEKIKMILSQANPSINTILNKKYWAQKKEYYLQNDKYYVGSEDERIEMNHIFEITKMKYSGKLVFDSDSTFFYFPIEGKPHTDKYGIKGIRVGRIPLNSLLSKCELQYFEPNPKQDYPNELSRYEFLIEKSPSGTKKVLFFPNKKMLIDNYGEKEQELINDLLNPNDSHLWNKLIYAILFLSIVFNIYWIIKRKSS